MTTHTVPARDGTPLAYRCWGEGPNLVFTNGLSANECYWQKTLERFEGRARLLTWDLKGHGVSGPARSRDQLSMQDSVDDLRRVLDAAGIDRGVFLGFSMGCQIILEAWRHIPDRIAALIPVLGTFEYAFDDAIHPLIGPLIAKVFGHVGPTMATLMVKATYLGTRLPLSALIGRATGIVGAKLSHRDMKPYFDHLGQLHGPTYMAMGAEAQRHSAADLLPTISVPTLIVAGGRDVFTPVHIGEAMARRIPNAEYLLLPEAAHTGLFEFPEEIGARIEQFLVAHGFLEG